MRRTLALIATTGLVLAGCGEGAGEGKAELTITANATSGAGGKNAAEAEWIEKWVIPKFVEAQKAKGADVSVKFIPSGVEDDAYKTRISLDLKSKKGADVIAIDGIWVGEFAQAGYIKPLADVGGAAVDQWEGWNQIPQAVQGLGVFESKRFGVPMGTDGRVLYFNKKLFAKAGLPADWQPTTWQEILDAGAKLKQVPGIIPLQINAGTAMTEATTMQGVLPLLAGTGTEIYANGKWAGGNQAVKDVLGFYQQVYGPSGLGDPKLQQEAQGRTKSFEQFAAGKIGILAESDYFWRDVVEPTKGEAKMADRDQAVGWALWPAQSPGKGLRGQPFVSMSGGAARVLNPNSKNGAKAWELLAFMHSAEATKAEIGPLPRISARTDVNNQVLAGDPMLKFISDKVLPITAYRPPLAIYPRVSTALQEATADIVAGKSPDEAAAAYQKKLEGIVGGPGNIGS